MTTLPCTYGQVPSPSRGNHGNTKVDPFMIRKGVKRALLPGGNSLKIVKMARHSGD